MHRRPLSVKISGWENQNNLIKTGGIYVKITYKDFLEIQKLKKQGITRNEAVLKTKYTQYVIYKYCDMPEDFFFGINNM